MSGWKDEALNEEVQAFIEFEPNQRGKFQFGYVRGDFDYRDGQGDGKPAVEWTWDGNDEMAPAQGRGWAFRKGDRIGGKLDSHRGDESMFTANETSE